MDKNNKQKLLLEYMISSPDIFALCRNILKSSYFTPDYRRAVDFLHNYYDKYSATPSIDQINAETSVVLKKQDVTKDQINYCTDEIEAFCRQKAIESAIVTITASDLIKKGDSGKIEQLVRDAISVSLTKDLGIHYFDNPLERLEENAKAPQRISTGWRDVDNSLGGGLARTELLLVSANSGGGKSITLANLAVNMVLQGLNVLYISLELSETMVAQRFDTMFTGVPSVNWQSHMYDMANTIEKIGPNAGELTIKRMSSGTSAMAIRAYLKEFELKRGIIPDLLVVDYLDLMGSNEQVSADNIWEKDKRATEQLRDILDDYQMMGATASQQNRAAIDATELNQGHIAGGISKVNTVDWYISIVMTPAMKIAGEMMFVFLKSRSSDAVGTQVLLKWDNTWLRVSNADKQQEEDRFEESIQQKKKLHKGEKKSLLDIMDI